MEQRSGARNITAAHPIGYMTYSQAPSVCEKNIFQLFGCALTQPVKNYIFYNIYNTLWVDNTTYKCT